MIDLTETPDRGIIEIKESYKTQKRKRKPGYDSAMRNKLGYAFRLLRAAYGKQNVEPLTVIEERELTTRIEFTLKLAAPHGAAALLEKYAGWRLDEAIADLDVRMKREVTA